jgi:hypothetical protein
MANKNAIPDHNVVVGDVETEVHCYQGSRLVTEDTNRSSLGECPFCDAKKLVLVEIPEARVHVNLIVL